MNQVYHDFMNTAMSPADSPEAWGVYIDGLHQSLDRIERMVNDTYDVREVCSDEWCEVNECILGEITHAVFAISEPHWSTEEDSQRLKQIKRRIHDLHAQRRGGSRPH